MIADYELTPWKLSIRFLRGTRMHSSTKYFTTKTEVLQHLRDAYQDSHMHEAILEKYEAGTFVPTELPTEKDTFWFIVTIDEVVDEFLLYSDAKKGLATLAKDIRKDPTFQRVAKGVYEYLPRKHNTLNQQYFIGTRKALISEGWEEQFEIWDMKNMDVSNAS